MASSSYAAGVLRYLSLRRFFSLVQTVALLTSLLCTWHIWTVYHRHARHHVYHFGHAFVWLTVISIAVCIAASLLRTACARTMRSNWDHAMVTNLAGNLANLPVSVRQKIAAIIVSQND